MKRITELKEQRNTLWRRAENFKEGHTVCDAFISPADAAIYNDMVDEVQRLGREIEVLERENVRQLESQPEKPPLGVKPYYITAWSRIGELAEAIYRQYEAAKGDPKLVSRWAEEIGWQCAMIQSLEEAENDG